jgi:hypothetical protein
VRGTWPIFAEQPAGLPGPDPTVEIVETEQTAERFRVDTMCLEVDLAQNDKTD